MYSSGMDECIRLKNIVVVGACFGMQIAPMQEPSLRLFLGLRADVRPSLSNQHRLTAFQFPE
jgi:hypothetical protein